MWVGGWRAGIPYQPIPDEFQKRDACHMTERFIPINHNYIILLRNIPETGGYRMAGVECLVRKLTCSKVFIQDRIFFFMIQQSISHIFETEAGCRQNACSNMALWVCDSKTE